MPVASGVLPPTRTQVLHPVAMQPAMRTGVPVRVKNSYNPSAPGTLVT